MASIHNDEGTQQNDETITKQRISLQDMGYRPIPVNGKSPVLKSWTTLTQTPTRDEISGWLRPDRYAYARSTGVVHDGHVMCLDVDCKDLALMRILHPIVLEHLPEAHVRIGDSPKAAYFFRSEGALVGETTSVPLRWQPADGLKAQIEVRGKGGQTLVAGIHPDTGQPYRWPHGGLPPVDELPACDRENLEQLLNKLKVAINTHYDAWRVLWRDGRQPGNQANGQPLTSDKGVTASVAFVELLLSGLDNATLDLDWEDWFHKVLMPVRGALMNEGDGGYSVFAFWSEQSEHHTEAGCQRTWDSFTPLGHIGIATLIRTVKELGTWTEAMQAEHELILDAHKPTAAEEFTAISGADYPNDYQPPTIPSVTINALADDVVIPPRPRLYGDHVLADSVTLLGGRGGVSKTLLALQEGIAIATGQQLMSDRCWFPSGLGVVHLNRDEPRKELERRIKGVCLFHGLSMGSLSRLHVLGRDEIPAEFSLVREEISGVPLACQVSIDWLCELLIACDAKVLQLDPLVSFCSGETNAHFVALNNAWRQVHERTGVAGYVVHHLRKGTPGEEHDATDDADSLRGGGALVDLARNARVLRHMSAKQAEAVGVFDEALRRRLVALNAGAKSNYFLSARDLDWYRLETVELGNASPPWPSDAVGVHVPWSPEAVGGLSADEQAMVLNAIRATYGADNPKWSVHPQASADRSVEALARLVGLDAGAVRVQIGLWLGAGVLTRNAKGRDGKGRTRDGLGVLVVPVPDAFS